MTCQSRQFFDPSDATDTTLNTFSPVEESTLIPYQAASQILVGAVLVFAPHPDDEVFGCGGALALHVRAAVPVRVVILTDGALGGDPQEASLAHCRQAESTAALAVIGVSAPEFWNLPDRGVSYDEPLVCRIMAEISAAAADLIYLPSLEELHPDHRAIALAGLEAVRRLQGERRIAFYEISAPLKPNLLLDIDPVMEIKRAAMRCFPSQLALQPYDEHIEALNRYRTYTLGGSVRAAEAYQLIEASSLSHGLTHLYCSEYQRRRNRGLPSAASDIPLVSVLIRSAGR
ncbi:MAG: PIG-L deacetylase family protein, partial [bacterium]